MEPKQQQLQNGTIALTTIHHRFEHRHGRFPVIIISIQQKHEALKRMRAAPVLLGLVNYLGRDAYWVSSTVNKATQSWRIRHEIQLSNVGPRKWENMSQLCWLLKFSDANMIKLGCSARQLIIAHSDSCRKELKLGKKLVSKNSHHKEDTRLQCEMRELYRRAKNFSYLQRTKCTLWNRV